MKHAATLIRRVRALATEYPEGLYTMEHPDEDEECSYTVGEVKNGPPTTGCLIGQAARGFIAIPIEDDRHGIESVLEALDVEGSEADFDWLVRVQTTQDNGKPWAEAISTADEWVNQ